jgi:hypothetical protein
MLTMVTDKRIQYLSAMLAKLIRARHPSGSSDGANWGQAIMALTKE